jgi:hypothetical protein
MGAERVAVAAALEQTQARLLEAQRPRIPALEQHKREQVIPKLKKLRPEDLAVLKHVLANGRMSVHEIRAAEEVRGHFERPHIVDSSLGRCATAGLINSEMVFKPFDVTEYWVKPDLIDALSFWLVERNGDLTRPSEDRPSPTPDP